MKIKSMYLNREIDIPETRIDDGTESVLIIPHDVLENEIYNSQEASDHNIQVHYTPVVTEPEHYAFLCAINDKLGRRIECTGESSPLTLTTEISKKYPVLMAAKRAFDDAAIKFLMLPGKVYSDEQIPMQEDISYGCDSTPSDITSEDVAEGSASSGDIEVDSHVPQDTPSAAAPDDICVEEQESEPDPEPVAPTTAEKTAAKVAPATKTASPKTTPAPSANAAPPKPDKVAPAAAEEPTATDGEGDEFDTIITCGKFKRNGFTVRQCYEKDVTSIEWIAHTLQTSNAEYRKQQEICRRYLEHVENGGQ